MKKRIIELVLVVLLPVSIVTWFYIRYREFLDLDNQIGIEIEIMEREECVNRKGKNIDTPIASLDRSSDISGRVSGHSWNLFVLGFGGGRGKVEGSVMNEMNYYFYEILADGAVRLSSIPAGIKIYEKDETPRLVRVFVSQYVNLGDDYTPMFMCRFKQVDTYLVVPLGTVTREYRI